MELAGIARDLTFDMFKKDGYNYVAPVFMRNGKYYIQAHKDESIYSLIDMVENINESERDEWLKSYLKLQETLGKDVGSISNHSYKFVEYDPIFGGDDMLRKRDETFHIEPEIDSSGEQLILGFSLDEDVFIGNAHFIISQLEILIGNAQTDEEFDILYRVYGMSEQFEQMGVIIKKALAANLKSFERMKWLHLAESYKVTMQVEKVIQDFKCKNSNKNVSLTK